MSLKIFTRKKKIVNKIDQPDTQKSKDQLDIEKIDKLDNMINLLKEISENIKTNVITKTVYENVVESKSQNDFELNSTFIPSINIEESDGISNIKKDVKKRNLSKTINKLKEI